MHEYSTCIALNASLSIQHVIKVLSCNATKAKSDVHVCMHSSVSFISLQTFCAQQTTLYLNLRLLQETPKDVELI
jgi:hypothetical protein